MGLSDREYLRDEQPGGFHLGASRSMVTNLMIVTVAVAIIDLFTDPVGDNVRSLSYLLSLKSDLARHPWNFWQLLTCGFAHVSIAGPNWSMMHLGMNMFMLWMFGRDVEARYGRLEFLRFYLTAIVIAALGWLVYQQLTSDVPSSCLGASGAVTAVLMLFIFNWPKRTLLLMGVAPIPAWAFGVMCVALDLFGSRIPGRSADVAYSAHLAGAAFGAAYYLLHWNLGRIVPDRLFDLRRVFRRRPSLKVHDPESYYQSRDAEADRVLKKLHAQGEASLSGKERKILEDYSRRMRQKHR